jgi:hypothetical protein
MLKLVRSRSQLGEATIKESASFINMFDEVQKHTSAFPLRIRLGDPNYPCTGCGKLFEKKLVVYVRTLELEEINEC